MKLRIAELNALCLILMMLSGNAVLGGIDLFFVVAAASFVVWVCFSEFPSISPMRLVAASLIVMICIVIIYISIRVDPPYLELYYLWSIKFAVMMVIGLLMGNFCFGRLVYVFFLFLSALTFLTGDIEGGRLFSFFGPNMLYRIYVILVFYSIFGYKRSFLNRFYCGLGVVVGLWLTILTGSTGGIFALLCTGVLCGLVKFNVRYLFFITILTIALFALPELLPPRVAHKIENFETIGRIVNWVSILERVDVFRLYIHSDFNDIWSFGFMYPHNIVLESAIFYGVFGYFLIILIALALFKSKGSPIHVILCVYFSGSLLSGDLSDNYPVLALSVLIILRGERFNWMGLNNKRLQ